MLINYFVAAVISCKALLTVIFRKVCH